MFINPFVDVSRMMPPSRASIEKLKTCAVATRLYNWFPVYAKGHAQEFCRPYGTQGLLLNSTQR